MKIKRFGNIKIIGWLVGRGHPSEKYEFVNWDDEIPSIWEKLENVPNHQPGMDFTDVSS